MKYSKEIEVIIFTHKRAMQLHFLLESLFKNLPKNTQVHVIYHENIDHAKSYNILKDHFKTMKIIFYPWGKRSYSDLLKRIIVRPINIIWLIRFPVLIKRYCDFQKTLENILKLITSSYVMLLTDDQYFINSLSNTKTIFDRISNNPKRECYWSHVTPFFKYPYDFKRNISSVDNKVLSWDTSEHNRSSLFAYRFHVDGTIYYKNALYKLLKKTIYHLPTTLEAVGLWESRLRGYFQYGLMGFKRVLVGIQANNIQTISQTPHANFNINLLMKAYCAGFRMQADYEDLDDLEYIYIPKKLQFNNSKLNLININYNNLHKYIDEYK